jgi:hypothetical protein
MYDAPLGTPPGGPSFVTRQHKGHKGSLRLVPLPKPIGAVMADNPEAHPEKVPAIPVSDTPHAPFIFYEAAPAFGFTNGVVNITLSANRTYAGPEGTIVNEQVVVAYLRGNLPAALSLRHAINSALLLAAPTGQDKAS